MRKVVLAVVFVIVVIGCYVGLQFVTAFRTTGTAAVQAMTPSEQAYLTQHLERIPAGATLAQVEQILGAPYRPEPRGRPSWHGPDGKTTSRINVYFRNERAYKIRWLKIGRFFWEKDLGRQ